MFKKIMSLYENSILYSERPLHVSEQYYIFFNQSEKQWLAIPKSNLTEKELNLLQILYEQVNIPSKHSGKWYEFLLVNGPLPTTSTESNYRIIQFHIKGHVEQDEIESALNGFFSDEVQYIWEDSQNGCVIEEKKQMSLSESELASISDTVESDLYVKISFYIGKLFPLSNQLPNQFRQEKEYFQFAKNHLSGSNIFTFEKVFLPLVAANLPGHIKEKLNKDFLEVFLEDPELYVTIKVFLENNLNASMTAKKLYVHRNTLQYRLDKFIDKTGVQLKDFYGAFTVFLAILLFEYDNLHK
ncbi:helix-turn-helix domain-containing protein [Neobacillus niacini]|uniref:PucR family transcriptional regulator n=1 Tax=Neobacillus niacini TaxID=86668 RepID=UPI002FFF21B4